MSDKKPRRLLLTLIIPIGITPDEFTEGARSEGTLDERDRAGVRWSFRQVEHDDGSETAAVVLVGPPRAISRVAEQIVDYVDPCGCPKCVAARAEAQAEALLRTCGVVVSRNRLVEA
jgi:hypothetical protein